MKQVLGISCLLLFVFLATAVMSESFLIPFNLENLMKRSSLFGIISIGVAFVIITGGIDLSIGSVICLVGCGLPFLLQVNYVPRGDAAVVGVGSGLQSSGKEAASATLELSRRIPGLAEGDRVRLSGGDRDNPGLFRVTSIRETEVILDPRPPLDSSGRRLTRVYPFTYSDDRMAVPGHGLKPRDRVAFVLENGREGVTARVRGVVGEHLELSEPPPANVAAVVALDRRPRTSVPVALAIVLGASLAIGLFHGLLIARLKLQPFVVTLCGLLLYRGITRGFTEDQTQGLGDEYPTLKLIATAELAQVSTSGALELLGGLLVAAGAGWGWIRWRRRGGQPAAVLPAVVSVILGLGLVTWGMVSASTRPKIAIAVAADSEVTADLPAGTNRVRLEARETGGPWVALDEIDVRSTSGRQQLEVPSLETIRGFKPGAWSQFRAVVVDRSLPKIGLPAPVVILVIVAVLAAVFLNHTVHGRYLLAMGNNEEAARYSGINTDRMTVLAYVICAGLAGLGGVLFVLDINSAQPVDFGNFYELYAIAAAVLGGCSLRGGEGTILGVVIGASLMRVLKNMITLVDWIPTHIEYAIIGAVILAGVTADELVKRLAARRRAQRIREANND